MTVVSSIRTSTGKLAAGAFLALSLSLAGCASTSGVGTASPGAVGQASTVYHGTVTSVREVTIKRDSSIIGTATDLLPIERVALSTPPPGSASSRRHRR